MAIPIRFYIYAGIAALIGYLLWREHHLTRKLASVRIELSQANANYQALQAAQAHERKISTEASNDYERRLTDLAKDRTATPVRSVRLRNCTPSNMSATTTTPRRVDEAGSAGYAEATGQDIGDGRVYDRFSDDGPDAGPALYALADSKDQQLARCASLQLWVDSR